MPKSFERVRLAVVGKLEDSDKFPGWVRYHGGEFSKKIDSRVTHLIASEEAFRKNVEAVQEAKQLGTVHIVQPDWLYDSLDAKSAARPKAVVSYLWDNVLEPELKPRKRKQSTPSTAVPKPKRGIKDPFAKRSPAKRAKTTALPKGNVFIDEGFNEPWDATLHRTLTNGKREKFQLAIFESTQKPPTYSAYAKYSRIGRSEISVLAPPKSDLIVAKTKFQEFFALQTGTEWEDRSNSDASRPMPKKDEKGNVLPAHEGWYIHQSESILSAFLRQPEKPQAAKSKKDEEPEAPSTIIESEGTAELHGANASSATGGNVGKDSGFEGDVKSREASPAKSLQDSTLCALSEKDDKMEITKTKNQEVPSKNNLADVHGYGTGIKD